MWLNDAMITNTYYNSTDPNVGLSLNSDFSTRKCYMMDTGLLITQTFLDGDYTENDLYKAYNSTDPNVGLSLNSDFSTRKCYMMDTGLLITQTFLDGDYTENDLYKAVLFNKLNINEGMVMENVTAQILRTNGHKLFFYSKSDRENKENNMEIDFLIKDKENLKKISVIEVKSSTYKKHSSLDKFRNKYKERIGNSYILYQKDLMIKEGVIHLPIYMSIFL